MIAYINYRELDEFYTLKGVCQQLISAMKVGREWRISRDYLEAFLRSEMA